MLLASVRISSCAGRGNVIGVLPDHSSLAAVSGDLPWLFLNWVQEGRDKGVETKVRYS